MNEIFIKNFGLILNGKSGVICNSCTVYTDFQVLELSKKYKNIFLDLNDFQNNLNQEPFSDLWWNIFKYRIKNSSIPTWKRWWFRIIIKKLEINIYLYLFIQKPWKKMFHI